MSATFYIPFAQWMEDSLRANASISIRVTGGRPELLTRSVAETIASVDKDLSLIFLPLSDQINSSLVQERLTAMLAGFFGALALLLAGIGLYGVTAYSVGRRRREIGIRIALGAKPAVVVRMVVGRVAVLVGLGIVIGTAVSLWASQFVEKLLFGLRPRGPLTLAVAPPGPVETLPPRGRSAQGRRRLGGTLPTLLDRELRSTRRIAARVADQGEEAWP